MSAKFAHQSILLSKFECRHSSLFEEFRRSISINFNCINARGKGCLECVFQRLSVGTSPSTMNQMMHYFDDAAFIKLSSDASVIKHKILLKHLPQVLDATWWADFTKFFGCWNPRQFSRYNRHIRICVAPLVGYPSAQIYRTFSMYTRLHAFKRQNLTGCCWVLFDDDLSLHLTIAMICPSIYSLL